MEKPIEMKSGDFNSSHSQGGARMPDMEVTFPFGKAMVRQVEVLKIGMMVAGEWDDPSSQDRRVALLMGTDTIAPGPEVDGAGMAYLMSQEDALMIGKRLIELAGDMGERAMKDAVPLDSVVRH